jgi:hypothetical protein
MICKHLGKAVGTTRMPCSANPRREVVAFECPIHRRCIVIECLTDEQIEAWRQEPEARIYSLCIRCPDYERPAT